MAYIGAPSGGSALRGSDRCVQAAERRWHELGTSPDRAYARLFHYIFGNSVLTPLGVLATDPANQGDLVTRDPRTVRKGWVWLR